MRLRRVEACCRSWHRNNGNTKAVTRMMVSHLQETDLPSNIADEKSQRIFMLAASEVLEYACADRGWGISFRAAYPTASTPLGIGPLLAEPWLLIQNCGALFSHASALPSFMVRPDVAANAVQSAEAREPKHGQPDRAQIKHFGRARVRSRVCLSCIATYCPRGPLQQTNACFGLIGAARKCSGKATAASS